MITIRNLIGSIKNLVVWFPVIWRDRHYDYMYFLKIMKKKLELMERYAYSDDSYYADKNKKQIKIARILVERLVKDEYESPEQERCYELYFNPELRENIIWNLPTEEKEKRWKKIKRFQAKEAARQKYDLEYLTVLFNKHLFWWWD